MSRVLNFVMERNPDAAVSFIHVKKGGLSEIIEKLTEIVTSEKDCVFEAAGGSDEALIALGVVSERFGIPIVKADYDKRTLVPVMAGGLFTHNADAFDGTVGKKKDVNKEKGKLLSIYEIIELGGGMICGYENNIFNISPALYRDISVLWQAGRGDCSFWSSVCNVLLPMQSKATGLKVKAPLTERLRSAVPFVEKLSELGFIKDFKCTEMRQNLNTAILPLRIL